MVWKKCIGLYEVSHLEKIEPSIIIAKNIWMIGLLQTTLRIFNCKRIIFISHPMTAQRSLGSYFTGSKLVDLLLTGEYSYVKEEFTC